MNQPMGRWTPGMNESRGHDAPDGQLAEIDALLASYARHTEIPEGLSGRVYRASVAHLATRRTHTPLAFFKLRPVSLVPQLGRLALAASIGIAFVVAIRALPLQERRAPLLPSIELLLLESAGPSEADVAGLFEFEDPRFGAVEQLLLTRDMTFRDLSGDLAQLARDLEM